MLLIPAWSYGWLRVPDHDVAGKEAWEEPDGQLYWVHEGTHPYIYKCNDGSHIIIPQPVGCSQ